MHRQCLRQKECHDYVGGRLIWEEIKAAHPEIVRPLRKTEQGWEYYLVSTVDTALKAAQLFASLIHRCLALFMSGASWHYHELRHILCHEHQNCAACHGRLATKRRTLRRVCQTKFPDCSGTSGAWETCSSEVSGHSP